MPLLVLVGARVAPISERELMMFRAVAVATDQRLHVRIAQFPVATATAQNFILNLD